MKSRYYNQQINEEIQNIYENDAYRFTISKDKQEFQMKTNQPDVIMTQLAEDLVRATRNMETLMLAIQNCVKYGTVSQEYFDTLTSYIYDSEIEESKQIGRKS